MSAPTLRSPHADGPRTGGPRLRAPYLRGPYRTTLKLHRTALWSVVALVVAVALATGGLRWWVAATDGQVCGHIDVDCSGWSGYESALGELRDFGGLTKYLFLWPALVAAFVAGPLIGREMESGTYKLAWTQSDAPARWLRSRLVPAALVACLAALALAGLAHVVQAPLDPDWWGRGTFESYGPVLVAYSLFAVALGALTGLLVRRAIAALALAGGLAAAVPLLVGTIRWDVWPAVTGTGGLPKPESPLAVGGGMQLHSGYLTSSGDRLPFDACWQRTMDFQRCPSDLHITGWFVDYHPHAHLWYVQIAESAAVLGLAAVALHSAVRVLRGSTA